MEQALQKIDMCLSKLEDERVANVNDVYKLDAREGDVDDYNRSNPGFLGQGTYGVVRRRMRDGRSYAVKEMAKVKLAADKKVLEHTLVEISVLKCLRHPGCISLHRVLHSKDMLYLVTTLCQGTLFDYIKAQPGSVLPTNTSAIVLKQLLMTLEYLHQAIRVVHRDIKPENILIDPDTLAIKLIDFGMAKFIGKKKNPAPAANTAGGYGGLQPGPHNNLNLGNTSPGVLVTPGTCTELYAPREVLLAMLHSNKGWTTSRENLLKVDIYAAGVVGYVMLLGRLPYLTAAYQQAQSRHTRIEETTRLMQGGIGNRFPRAAKSLPHKALWCVCRLMENDVARRPSATEALQDPWLDGLSLPTHPITPGAGRNFGLPTGVKAEAKVVPSRMNTTTIAAPPPRKRVAKQHNALDSPNSKKGFCQQQQQQQEQQQQLPQQPQNPGNGAAPPLLPVRNAAVQPNGNGIHHYSDPMLPANRSNGMILPNGAMPNGHHAAGGNGATGHGILLNGHHHAGLVIPNGAHGANGTSGANGVVSNGSPTHHGINGTVSNGGTLPNGHRVPAGKALTQSPPNGAALEERAAEEKENAEAIKTANADKFKDGWVSIMRTINVQDGEDESDDDTPPSSKQDDSNSQGVTSDGPDEVQNVSSNDSL